LDTGSNNSDSLSLSPTNKILQSETGKLITKKAFTWLENRIKRSKFNKEVEHILQSIFIPDDNNAYHKFFDKYLCFRMISSANEDVFIGDIYHPITLSKKSKNTPTNRYNLVDIISNNKITCLIGRAGQGKTTALRKIILEILQAEGEPALIPFIIQLRDVDWKKEGCITKLLAKELTYFGFDITAEQSSYLLQEGVVKVLFDGFDEVESKHHQLASKVINETYSKYNTSCIVTTRPNTPISYASSHTTNYEFLDLTIDDVISIIKKYKNINDKYKENLINVVKNSETISKILISPVMVDIFIYVYPELLEEPKNIVDFYRPLFDFITLKHDRLKGAWERHTASGTSNLELKEIFCALSFHSIAEESAISVDETKLFNLCTKALNSLAKSNLASDRVVEDIIQRTSLIQQDGLSFSYIHKSICEFYAAEFIRGLPEPSKIKFYENIAIKNQVKFKNVLKFLSEIDSPFFYTHFARKCLKVSQYERNRHQHQLQAWHIAVFTSFSEVLYLKNGKGSEIKVASESDGASLNFLLEIIGLDFPEAMNDVVKVALRLNRSITSKDIGQQEHLNVDSTGRSFRVPLIDICISNQKFLRDYIPKIEQLYIILDGIQQKNDKYEQQLNGQANLIDDMFNFSN